MTGPGFLLTDCKLYCLSFLRSDTDQQRARPAYSPEITESEDWTGLSISLIPSHKPGLTSGVDPLGCSPGLCRTPDSGPGPG